MGVPGLTHPGQVSKPPQPSGSFSVPAHLVVLGSSRELASMSSVGLFSQQDPELSLTADFSSTRCVAHG
jgi:hypothetical protein